ncbi:two component transcriptional regulator winged helix family [Bacteroides sp. CAG:702]|nr:two component transcriptional regulator winged helix family [Bacteroides sp. CAG:702]
MVEGFELGGNDYLKKPFGMQELIVRIKALLGRASNYSAPEKQTSVTEFEIGRYRFNAITQRLSYLGSETELSHRESEILRRLCENRNEVTLMQDILIELWGNDTFFNQRSLHVFITKLRHKLSRDERIHIVNVRGIGYKLIIN